MNKIFLLSLIFGTAFIFPSIASATWNCVGKTFNDCSGQYPVECCAQGVVNCLPSGLDCNQFCCSGSCTDYTQFRFCNVGQKACCISGVTVCIDPSLDCDQKCCINGCTVWSDYYFCKQGETIYCTSAKPAGVCCNAEYSKLNPSGTGCWKPNWECTMDNECQAPKKCINNICQCVSNWQCNAWNTCTNGQQDRVCNDGCGNAKTETQNCTVASTQSSTNCQALYNNADTLKYFGICHSSGFNYVCFEKYTSQYIGCMQGASDDCTDPAHNSNAVNNIKCESNYTLPTNTNTETPPAVCPTIAIPCSLNSLNNCNYGSCPNGYVAGQSNSCGFHNCVLSAQTISTGVTTGTAEKPWYKKSIGEIWQGLVDWFLGFFR